MRPADGAKQYSAGLLVLASFAVFCGAALSQPKSDWELKHEDREWQEGEVKLPEYPKPVRN